MNEEIAKVQASSGMSIDIHWQRADAGRDDPAARPRTAPGIAVTADARRTSASSRSSSASRCARLESTPPRARRRWRSWRGHSTTVAGTRSSCARRTASGAEARDLTRHEHDSGSGGEKAISLHLPLLAAAASYPASGKPDALRMVMLDEAFTRIDDEGRRGIMGLISKFDLDIMLTSPDYWGCCAEVPELDIYVLAPRDASAPRCRRSPLPLGRRA